VRHRPVALSPPQTDWLHHRLTIAGAADDLSAFRQASAGPGIIPWHLDLDRLEEDWFHLLVSPTAPQQRSLSLSGARILAGQLREAVSRRHELALGLVGHSRACPFDLQVLVPVPDEVLRLGSDDGAAIDWLWAHWGTTQALRHVVDEPVRPAARRGEPVAESPAMTLSFWSADWSPWRALEEIRSRWPALSFTLRPTYGAA
jgi:hypothetical protein